MTTISEDLDLPGESTVDASIDCILGVVDTFGRYISAFDTATGITIVSPRVIGITNGTWAEDLVPTSRISPAGAIYRRILNGSNFRMDDRFDVPDSGGPYTVMERKVDEPSYVGSAALEQHILDYVAHAGGYTDRAKQMTSPSASSGTALYRHVPWTVTVQPSDRLQIVEAKLNVESVNPTIAFTGGSLTSNVVTLTGLPGGHGIVQGEIIQVDAATSLYDGAYVVTSVGANQITYAKVNANNGSSGAGTIVRNLPSLVTAGLFDAAAFNAFAVKDGCTVKTGPIINPQVAAQGDWEPLSWPSGVRVMLEFEVEPGSLAVPTDFTVGTQVNAGPATASQLEANAFMPSTIRVKNG